MTHKQIDQDLRGRLQAYRKDGRDKPLTNAQLARELDVSVTKVSKYLNDKYDHDVGAIEERIADVLKGANMRRADSLALFTTPVSREVERALSFVRRTNDMGLLTGPAGLGKTSAIKLYAAEHPSSIPIYLRRWRCQAAGVAAMMFDAVETAAWPGNENRTEWLVKRLRGANRLIIVDNAQRLTASSREWIFDLHDETQCPVALVGTMDLLAAVRSDDQQYSRIGINIDLSGKSTTDAATRIVGQVFPDPPDDLVDMAVAVASQFGHLRALVKQLLLAEVLADTSQFKGDIVAAFHGAHGILIRDYTL